MFMLMILPAMGLLMLASMFMSLGEVVTGDNDDNELHGTDRNDLMLGYGGDDQIHGHGGNDLIFGGSGDDTIDGGSGNDWLFGNRGNDLIYGGEGDDFLSGGAGNDTLFGGAGNDRLAGVAGSNVLDGGPGDDTVSGIDFPQEFFEDSEVRSEMRGLLNTATRGFLSADDLETLVDLAIRTGPAGEDLVMGGDGNDLLLGDSGDTLVGGAGSDSFVVHYTGLDDYQPVTIADFGTDDAGISLVMPPELAGAMVDLQADGSDTVLRVGGVDVMRLSGLAPGDISLDDLEISLQTAQDFYRERLSFAA